MSTIAERKQEQRTRHYEVLGQLAEVCEVPVPTGKTRFEQGKTLASKLWRLEQTMHQAAENYANGQTTAGLPYDKTAYTQVHEEIMAEVQRLFHHNLKGFFIDGDPRGHALKIQPEAVQLCWDAGVQLPLDWGGYGLLSPEITGKEHP